MSTQTFEPCVFNIAEKKESESQLSIIFTGDLCPRERLEPLVLSGRSGDILSEVKPELDAADIRVTNLETPLTETDTPIKKSGPNIKVAPGCIELLTAGDFDVALLANNHIGDFGPAPVMETVERLDAAGIKHAGAGENLTDASKPLFMEHKDLRIAFLNYAENEFGGAGRATPGSSPLDPLVNIGQISAVSEESDITAVIVHGGNEHNPVPSPRMKKTYRAFADAGADIVISIHTHCPQGFEIYNGVPIVYSLGNFLFDSESLTGENFDPSNFWWTGYMLKAVFSANGALSLKIIPHTMAKDISRLALFDDESATQFCKYIEKISDIIKDEDTHLKYWEAWCAKAGQWMANRLGDSKFPFPEDKFRDALVVRNIFTCEAHNELLRTFMRLVEERRVDDAHDFFPEIEKVSKADFTIINNLK